MDKNLIATASITTRAPRARAWQALVDPDAIRQYMFGTHAVSDWQEGSPIVWQGEWQGNTYQDKGVILQLAPGCRLQYSHFSPLSGMPDLPENYHTVTIELADAGDQTRITLTQDHNTSDEEVEHSAGNWTMMLASLKEFLEK